MKELLVYMKGKWHTAAGILLLLILQAICELTIPKCTANIINIGIGQSGIEDVLTEQISAEGMERLLLLMTEEEKETVLAGYTADGEVYTKNELSDGQEEELLSVMTAPMVAVYALSTDGADYEEVLGGDLYVPRGLDVFGLLSVLPDNMRIELTESTREQIRGIPQSLITQAAVNFVRDDLRVQGVDVETLQRKYLMAEGLRMLLAALGTILGASAALILAGRLAAAYAKELREAVFFQVLSFGGEELAGFSVSSLITRTTEDVRQIQQLLTMLFRMVLYAPILGIGASIKTVQMNRSMGEITVLAVLLTAGLILLLAFAMFLQLKNAQGLREQCQRTAREIVRGMPVIRAFGTEEREKKRFAKENHMLMRANLKVNRIMSVAMPAILLIMNGGVLLLVWYGAEGINDGIMGVGELTAYIQYMIMAANAFLTLSMLAAALPQGAAAARRISQVLGTEPAAGASGERPGEEPGGSTYPAVEFRKVTFAYPKSAEPVLHQISFTADYGETTAIVGGTGAGKTTLLQLIPGVYRPSDGMILIDGQEQKSYAAKELHQKIGYVPQEAVLFSGTVSSNLRFGKEAVSDEELWQAVTAAQAAGFLEKTGKGLETAVAQGGKNLSGGQRQRLTVARALIGHPQIYLLDDCFSALDQDTAARMRKSLAAQTASAAVILVTQDIRSAASAEKIIVLDRGQIAGTGTHEELMAACDAYRRIAYAQGLEVTEDARQKA